MNKVNENKDVNITGIDKLYLLRQLWENSSSSEWTETFHYRPFIVKEAEKKLAKNDFIDDFCGRPIKSNLSTNLVSSKLYDKVSSKAFEEIVKEIRSIPLH